MSETSELIAKQIMNGNINKRAWGDFIYNVKVNGASGDGVTDDTLYIQKSIDAATVSSGILAFSPGTYITGAITVPSNVTLWFANGAELSIKSGSTVTINGPIEAGLHQIFTGSGSVNGNIKVPQFFPQWFGAKADGVTNDSAAIQKSVNLTRNVFLPEGDYFIGSDTITVTSSCYISGTGRNTTRLLSNGTTNDVIKFSNIWSSWGLKDISIIAQATTADGSGINVDSSSDGWIENVYIENTFNGLTTKNAQANKYRNVDMWFFKSYGLHFNGNNNDHFVSDCFINGQLLNGSPGNGHGIRLMDKAEAITFDSCEVILCNYALTTDATVDTPGSRPAYCRFDECYFDSSTNGVLIDKAVNMQFNQCWVSNRPNSGMSVNTVDDVVFSQCSFMNNGQHGCIVQSTAKRVKFLGCSFISNSVTTPNNFSGLVISGGATDFIVQGCTATNSLGFTGTQNNGIVVVVGASDRYIIADNLVNGNTGSGVSDGGTGVNKRVENNY